MAKDIAAKVIARAWKDPEFKQKLLKNPKAALQEMGYTLPPNVEVRVIEDKQNCFTFVLPPAVAKLNEMTQSELEQIAGGKKIYVSCDCTENKLDLRCR